MDHMIMILQDVHNGGPIISTDLHEDVMGFNDVSEVNPLAREWSLANPADRALSIRQFWPTRHCWASQQWHPTWGQLDTCDAVLPQPTMSRASGRRRRG